jgi:hypothetical protein
MSKKLLVSILALALAGSLVGCSADGVAPTAATTTAIATEAAVTEQPATQTPTAPPTAASTTPPTNAIAVPLYYMEGKWKNVGSGTFGQMQQGAIVVFNGMNCNVFSPNDTYAFYEEGGRYRLDVTGLMGGNPSFTVVPLDNNNCELHYGSTVIALRRVG